MGVFKNMQIDLGAKMQQQSRLKKQNSLLRDGLPFELSLKSISETQRYERSQNTEAIEAFNAQVKNWAENTRAKLQASVRTMVRRDVALSDSIKPNFYHYSKDKKSEITRVGFSFAREGVYIHKGAGRGQGGYLGSKWTNIHGKLKTTNPESMGLMGTGNRRPILWFNPVIERELETLADIVANYSADIQIDATHIFIND